MIPYRIGGDGSDGLRALWARRGRIGPPLQALFEEGTRLRASGASPETLVRFWEQACAQNEEGGIYARSALIDAYTAAGRWEEVRRLVADALGTAYPPLGTAEGLAPALSPHLEARLLNASAWAVAVEVQPDLQPGALAGIDRALELDPGFTGAIHTRAHLLILNGATAQGIELCHSLLARDDLTPNFRAEILASLSLASRRLGDEVAATGFRADAVACDPAALLLSQIPPTSSQEAKRESNPRQRVRKGQLAASGPANPAPPESPAGSASSIQARGQRGPSESSTRKGRPLADVWRTGTTRNPAQVRG